jgi:serine/threonine protein kinase
MKQSDRNRIQEIFLDARELPDSERSAFVAKQCRGDSDCIHEVTSLLKAADRPSILDIPVVQAGWRPDNLIGTKIDDRYEVEKELASRGMGKVYRARNLEIPGKFVVIKLLPHAATKDPDAVRRFKREVQALSLISHPNIVTVIGANNLKDGTPYIVMEYIDGPTLRTVLSDAALDVKRAAAIIKQIGAAVNHFHDKGILHLDLKPENIMLQALGDGNEAVKIVDFGIAKIMDSIGATSVLNTVLVGTLAYMSPEQLRDGGKITAASDVYSMAVVACEMITGNRPLRSDRPSGQQLQKRVELPKGLATKVQHILKQALSFEPEKRYKKARQFGEELAEALLEDKQKGPVNGTWRGWKKGLIVVAGALILALLSFGGYTYLHKSVSPLQPLIATTNETKGFNYWLSVQRTFEGKDYEEPYKSNGDEKFHSGDKFQLNVRSVDSGYLYIFNEGSPQPGNISFTMIYPKRTVNDGSASLGANQTVQSDWIPFRGPAGTDNYWIVWSASPVSELEDAKNEALRHPQAGVTGQHLVDVKAFLKKMDDQVDARASKIKASQEVQVRKHSEFVVTLAKFEHR